jgi:hypothetical protein
VKLRRAYMASRALVCPIPKDLARALSILPGTQLCIQLDGRALRISRAMVTSEADEPSDSSTVLRTPVREKGH